MRTMPEYFETFDDHGHPAGLAARHVVHARGLWHRSAHVFLFDHHRALYVQRRAAGKDLYPNRWDFSVGEHLKPGESFIEGARRGLLEELGIRDVPLAPMQGVHRATCRIAELGLLDRELQQSFHGCYDGPVTADPDEVAAVELVRLGDLADWIRRSPDDFTPWFLSELGRLGILSVRAPGAAADSAPDRGSTP